MPTLRPDIQPFIDRLLNDSRALYADAAFARSFGRLAPSVRETIMERVEEERHRPQVIDESSGVIVSPALQQAARIEQMRRDMARDIDRYRENEVRLYQQRPPSLQTRWDFETWSREVEAVVAGIRTHWEARIAQENGGGTIELPAGAIRLVPQPTRPIVIWPDPADYGPNAAYRSMRGALSAYTRAVNSAYAAMAPTPANEEACDRVQINGSLAIRQAWNNVPIPETARRAHIETYPRPEDFFPPAFRDRGEATQAWADAMYNHSGHVPAHQLSREWNNHYHDGTRLIREAYRYARIAETSSIPRVPDPPPTTTPWREPEIDELDIMLKHLPRNRKFMLVVPDNAALIAVRDKLLADGRPADIWRVYTVRMMGGTFCEAVRVLRYPVFIDPAVFKRHLGQEGDWTNEELDEIIKLQGEIPDEETT